MTGEKFKILVADDEESLRGIVSEVLMDAGYEVECVEDGQQAIDALKATNDFHVVMTDIRMPGLNGIELLEAIKKFNEKIEVVIMTSHGSLDTAIKAIRLGAYDYLEKPFEDLDVITTVMDRTINKLSLELKIKRLVDELKQRNEDVEKLYEFTGELAKTLDRDEILIMAVKHVLGIGHGQRVIYFSFDEEKQNLRGEQSSDGAEVAELIYELKGAKVVADYFAKIDEDIELKKRMNLSPVPEHTFLHPVSADDKVVGVFAVASETEWAHEAKALIIQYGGNVSTQLEKANLYLQVKDLAIRDGLTGLYNHRFFKDTLKKEIARSRRFSTKFSVILFDLDHFKKYNDNNGHLMGDDLLREVGGMIQEKLRNIDVAARYGGEEFVIITMQTEKKGAVVLADRLRETIAKHKFAKRETQPLKCISVSIGVAEFPTDGDSVEALVDAADKALYKAKEGGRNQVVVAGK